jgi:hypothetical protein
MFEVLCVHILRVFLQYELVYNIFRPEFISYRLHHYDGNFMMETTPQFFQMVEGTSVA